MLSQLTVRVGQNQPSLSCHMAVTWSNSRGAFKHLGPKLQVGLHENFVPVALSWSQIFGATLLPHGRHLGQVEVWAEPLYKVLWSNLQHLSSPIGQCRGFFGTGLVCKAPFNKPKAKGWNLKVKLSPKIPCDFLGSFGHSWRFHFSLKIKCQNQKK
jgi:hypothetical protein